MASRAFLTATCALLACCATAVNPQRAHAGSTDAVFISSGQSTATTETAPYDSEYAAAQRGFSVRGQALRTRLVAAIDSVLPHAVASWADGSSPGRGLGSRRGQSAST